MANGQVTTGFSKPYVALYSAAGSTVTYTSGRVLARGVDVTVSPESSDENTFYADNGAAETAAPKFTNGTLSLTVDGLLTAAEKLVFGLGNPDTDGWIGYGDDSNVPYVGVGYIARVQSGGVVGFVPTIIPKVQFNYMETAAATQEEEIDWQTQALEAKIMRDDTANHNWKYIGALIQVDGTTHATEASAEAAAEAAVKKFLGNIA